LEQGPIVGHEDHCPLVAVERAFELIDRRQVEMVRGLVEDETVHASQRELRERRDVDPRRR
jgi:hypothetical protein